MPFPPRGVGHGERRRGRERERKRAGSAVSPSVLFATMFAPLGRTAPARHMRGNVSGHVPPAPSTALAAGHIHAGDTMQQPGLWGPGTGDRQVSQGGVVCGGVASAAYSLFSRGKCAKHTVAHDMRRHSNRCRFFPKHNAYGIPCGVRGRCRERRWMEMTENDDATRCSTSPEVRGERGGSCDIVFPTPHKPIACCSQRHSALLADGSLISKVAQGHRQSSRGGKNVACEPGPNIGRFRETMRR